MTTILNGGFTNSGCVTGTLTTASITSPSIVTAGGRAGTGAGYTFTGTTVGSNLSNGTGGKLVLNGDNADITINGESAFKQLSERLRAVEQRLNILHINPELESDWQELRELGRLYRAKEQEILEGIKIWDIMCN